MKKFSLLIAALLAACGGAAPKPADTATQGPPLAEVLLYRPHAGVHAADYPFVYVDNVKKDPLADNSSVALALEPGMHRIVLKNPALWEAEQFWQFNAVAGRRYYFRLFLGEDDNAQDATARYKSRFARVDERPEATAKAELEAMQPAKE